MLMILSDDLREMGGAPRNPAPRNRLLVWIVKPPGCRCTDAFGVEKYRRVPTPLRSTSPFSDDHPEPAIPTRAPDNRFRKMQD